jgi:hypothetical protein
VELFLLTVRALIENKVAGRRWPVGKVFGSIKCYELKVREIDFYDAPRIKVMAFTIKHNHRNKVFLPFFARPGGG